LIHGEPLPPRFHPRCSELVGNVISSAEVRLVSFAHVHLGVISKAEPRIRPFDAKNEGGDSPTESVPAELSPMLP